MVVLLLIIFVLIILITVIIFVNIESLVIKNLKLGKKVLVILAHPDDEIMISGTIAKNRKTKFDVIYLTHGEDGPTGGEVEQENLGEFRLKELEKVSEILKYNSMHVLDFPDRYLNTVDNNIIVNKVQTIIDKSYDSLITFDTNIGLYGHSDHVCAGEVGKIIFESNNISQLVEMTLPKIQINLALKVSNTFKKNYTKPLPKANCSAFIYFSSKQKLDVVYAHKSQKEVVGDVLPLHNNIPRLIYFLFFSCEYFKVSRK